MQATLRLIERGGSQYDALVAHLTMHLCRDAPAHESCAATEKIAAIVPAAMVRALAFVFDLLTGAALQHALSLHQLDELQNSTLRCKDTLSALFAAQPLPRVRIFAIEW